MTRAAAWLPVLIAGACFACGPDVPLVRRLERDLLLREKAALDHELTRAASDVANASALVVIPATLVDELLAVALPVQTTVDKRFRITADSARVDFKGGLALVRMKALVEWLGRDVSARIEVIGALQVLDIEATGKLNSRIEILGFDISDVNVGALSGVASRLLDELAEQPASDLNELLSNIEIPVRLLPTIPLPAVEEPEVSIAAVDIPLETSIQHVRVGSGRLWVYIGLRMPVAGL
jgi:hypothetical protein